ncbi:MAG: inorganic pyrophosphatase [Chloroflexi bacterium]|nr:MAG: inorganic pyrophosphatase [Chloroflexota bacterium]
MNNAFWKTLEELLATGDIVIDRPKNQPHPRFPEKIYPLDYGYLAGTTSADGDGIDVWVGSQGGRALVGILCTFDTIERDAEIKLLAGCTPADVETILAFHGERMRVLFIPHPGVSQ